MAIRRKGLEIEIISVLDELTEIKKRTNEQKNETLIKKRANIKKKESL